MMLLFCRRIQACFVSFTMNKIRDVCSKFPLTLFARLPGRLTNLATPVIAAAACLTLALHQTDRINNATCGHLEAAPFRNLS